MEKCHCCKKVREIELFFYSHPVCERCWRRECRQNDYLKKIFKIPITPTVKREVVDWEDEADDSDPGEATPPRKKIMLKARKRVKIRIPRRKR